MIFSNFKWFVLKGGCGEKLVCRMASKLEKAVDKAASITLDCKLIICGRSVWWWDEEFHQLVKDHRACFAQGLDKDNNRVGIIANVNNNYRKIIKAFS